MKRWKDMTQEERQLARASWKTLPKHYSDGDEPEETDTHKLERLHEAHRELPFTGVGRW